MAGPDRLTELAGVLGARMHLPQGPVAVALSGGADSAALLWLAAQRHSDVVAIHVFHGLAASSLMATAAGQVAVFVGVPLVMAVVEPAGTAEHHLRAARHTALLDRAGQRPVLLAHTADDQAETVLMRVLRGTGVDGLAGIQPERGQLVHPMLGVTRAEARELARLAGLPFRDDPANEDSAVLRNRIRSDVVPVIEEVIGRPPRDALVRLAASAAEDAAFLDSATDAVPIEYRGESARMPLGALLASGDVVAGRVLRRALTRLAGPYPPNRRSLRRMLDVVHGVSAATQVEPGLRIRRLGPHVVVDRQAGIPAPEVPPASLAEDVTRWGDWRFDRSVVDGPAVRPLSPRRIVAPGDGGAWEVRAVTADDRITGRAASDALADAGVGSEARSSWPAVSRDGEVVWLPGVRARVWPVHRPGRYLCLVAAQEPNWQTSEP
ncbi:MAG TPA: tRNA lysidine(34) synthetase TilS [Acidimicrobiia bacterium]|nr:tRNA lysidine(34) synthetase TilS [Acidimicrobiia bacterium]